MDWIIAIPAILVIIFVWICCKHTDNVANFRDNLHVERYNSAMHKKNKRAKLENYDHLKEDFDPFEDDDED